MKKYALYIDGFNLYHSGLKNTSYKWLNPKKIFQNLNFKDGKLVCIKYFSANVIPHAKDKSIHIRQQIYFRALKTVPEISIHLGQFKKRRVKGQLLNSEFKPKNGFVYIEKFEEKGSDVNIANHMLADGFLKKYDVPILISNDSDLAGTLDLIKKYLKIPVGVAVANPIMSYELKKRANFKRKISNDVLKNSLFKNQLIDKNGKFSKPKGW